MPNIQETFKDIYHKLKDLNKRVTQARQAGGSHSLLSSVHPDTSPDTVVAGDIVYGHTGPVWKRLPKGNNNQVLTLDSGLPAWKDAPEAGAGGVFEDNFDDLDIYWAWTKVQTGATKLITEESAGVLNIATVGAVNAYWPAGSPHICVSLFGGPCVVEIKIADTTTINDLTAVGVCIDQGGDSTADSYHIERRRDDGNSQNGIYCMRWGTELGNVTPMTTLPVWLRMRWGGGHRVRSTVYFDYSINGTTWYNITSDSNSGFYPGNYGLTANLYGRNWTVAYPAIDVDFEYFKMTLDEGPG